MRSLRQKEPPKQQSYLPRAIRSTATRLSWRGWSAATSRRLNERTAQEMQIYERTRRELENETSPETWESKNEALRRIGLRTIPNPKEQE